MLTANHAQIGSGWTYMIVHMGPPTSSGPVSEQTFAGL